MFKKGQITVFIILGIVLAISVAFLISVKLQETQIGPVDSFPVDPVKMLFDRCLEKTLKDGLIFIGKQGGYYSPPPLHEKLSVPVPYYFYFGKQFVPSQEVIQQELSNYVVHNINQCNFSSLEAQGYNFTFGTASATSSFTSNLVFLDLDYSLSIKLGQQEKTLTRFSTSLEFNFEKINLVIQALALEQQQEPNAMPLGLLTELSTEYNFKYTTINLGPEKRLFTLYFNQSFDAEPYLYAFMARYNESQFMMQNFSAIISNDTSTKSSFSSVPFSSPHTINNHLFQNNLIKLFSPRPLLPLAAAQEEMTTEPALTQENWNNPAYLQSQNNADLVQSVNDNPALLDNPVVRQEVELRLNDPSFVSDFNEKRSALNTWAEKKGFTFGEEGTLESYDAATGLVTPKGEESQPFDPSLPALKGATVMKSGKLRLSNGVEISNAVLEQKGDNLHIDGGKTDLTGSKDTSDMTISNRGTAVYEGYTASSEAPFTVKFDPEGHPIISGDSVVITSDIGKQLSFTGTTTLFKDHLAAGALTQLVELTDATDTNLPSSKREGVVYLSEKGMDYYWTPGSCKNSANCIERNFATGTIDVKAQDNIISVRSYDKSIASIKVPPLKKDSQVIFSENDEVVLQFTERPVILSGDPTKLTTKVESEYLAPNGAKRTLKLTPGEDGIRASYCSPSCKDAGILTKDSLLKMQSFSAAKSKESQWIKELSQEYGGAHVFKGISYLEGPSRLRILDATSNAASRQEIDPNFLSAVVLSEGLTNWVDYNYNQNPNSELNAFTHIGFDRFGAEAKALKEEGYLPADFDNDNYYLKGGTVEGETGEIHKNVQFRNIESAMDAVAATLHRRQDLFTQDLQKNGINPSDLSQEDIEYWTYVYYNSGSGPPEDPRGTGRSKVAARASQGPDAFKVPHGNVPEYTPCRGDPYGCVNSLHNAQRVIGTKQLLDRGMPPALPETAAVTPSETPTG